MNTAMLASVLGASLLGSVHCSAMCGPFMCLYAPDAKDSRAHAFYHAGRLSSYLALGIVAGLIGSSVDQLGSFAGYARLAPVVGGLLLITWGLAAAYRALGITFVPRARAKNAGSGSSETPPVPLARRVIAAGRGRPAHQRAYLVGLSSTLLPCGWLYAFAATAAGTGSVLSAATVMTVFWLGTLPAMTAAGLLIQRLTGPLRARLPLITAAAMIVVGAVAVTGRLTQPTQHHTSPTASHASHR